MITNLRDCSTKKDVINYLNGMEAGIAIANIAGFVVDLNLKVTDLCKLCNQFSQQINQLQHRINALTVRTNK